MSMMDLVATSQPLYEQEILSPSDLLAHPAVEPYDSEPGSDHEWDDEIVPSSQPFEDGEDLQLPLGPMGTTNLPLFCLSKAASPPNSSMDPSAPHPRRAHLVFRASPVKPKVAPTVVQGTGVRSRKLVRRVTMDAEIERRRKRACRKARHIVKKLRALATATMKLKRQHRDLCKFVGDTYAVKIKQRITSL
ncbi:hypothetical protein C8R43DRAFT_1129868 [Mycena crocata]|nr:hypothetical protein C8R43DRAFT_1129868 [Mycena crocata]